MYPFYIGGQKFTIKFSNSVFSLIAGKVALKSIRLVTVDKPNADGLTGEAIRHARYHRIQDSLGIQRGQDGAGDLCTGFQGIELIIQLNGHLIKRLAKVFELIPAGYFNPVIKIVFRNLMGPFL